jgi:glycosyltransferase involved in cell wall biosynthesis
MRVVHVSHTSHPGGAELALARLVARDKPWAAAICAPLVGDAFDALGGAAELDLTLPAFPVGGTRGKNPRLAAKYLAALRSNAKALKAGPLYQKANVVHANTALAGILSALAGHPSGAPLVLHLRDTITPESVGRFGYEAFTRVAIPRCDGVIANSQTTLDSAAALLPARVRRQVIQSPSGIAARVTEPEVAASVSAVGMIGRLQSWKGQHVFLRAFADAFAGKPVRAYIAGAPIFGEDAYEAELRDIANRLGIAGQVDFLGHVTDIPEFLGRIDVLVHASTRPEPLGQSVIQGLAAAKPVIATEGSGPSELIDSGHNGLLITRDSVDGMAEALRAVASSFELRQRLAKGAAQHPNLLTDDQCVAAHAEFFRSVAASASAEGEK